MPAFTQFVKLLEVLRGMIQCQVLTLDGHLLQDVRQELLDGKVKQ